MNMNSNKFHTLKKHQLICKRKLQRRRSNISNLFIPNKFFNKDSATLVKSWLWGRSRFKIFQSLYCWRKKNNRFVRNKVADQWGFIFWMSYEVLVYLDYDYIERLYGSLALKRSKTCYKLSLLLSDCKNNIVWKTFLASLYIVRSVLSNINWLLP